MGCTGLAPPQTTAGDETENAEERWRASEFIKLKVNTGRNNAERTPHLVSIRS